MRRDKSCILVDGSSYLFRAYHAMPPLTNSAGVPTGALYGCLNMLRKLIKEYNPSYLAVVFDSKGPTTRHQYYPEYKANRAEMPEELAVQIAPLQASIRAMGIPLIAISGIEADDIIGTLALQAWDHGLEVLISTGDKDFAQLVKPHLTLVNTMTGSVLDEAGVLAKFDVHPHQIVDYLTLVGDTVDNVPGVEKVGPKTAAKWLKEYESLDNIIAAADTFTGKIGENLRKALPWLPTAKRLVTIDTAIEVPVVVENLVPSSPDLAALKTIFEENDFKAWRAELNGDDKAEVTVTLETTPLPSIPLNSPVVALLEGELLGIGWEGKYYSVPQDNELFKEWLRDPKAILVSCEIKELLHHYKAEDSKATFYDVGLLSYVKATHKKYELPKDALVNKLVSLEQTHSLLKADLEAHPPLWDLYASLEAPVMSVLARMEARGILVDVAKLEAQSAVIGARLDKLSETIYILAGSEFNIQSPKQLQEILFEKLGLPVLEKTPTGQPSTGESVLSELAESYELPRHILTHRSLSKLKSTYIDSLPKDVNPETGRIHTTFQQTVTSTGRLSSQSPNLQNIPIRTEEGRAIRSAFIAEPGWELVSADYSQIELRIMAHWSEDPGLIKAFTEDLDVHAATAAEIFGIPLDQVTHDQRRYAKTINFGLIYGMSSFGLAKALKVSREEAQHFIDTYFARYPGVARYMEETREFARLHGYVETLQGRRLYTPDINAKNHNLRQGAERAAINAPMQGTAADIMKVAMIAADKYCAAHGDTIRCLLQVHDELVFEVRKEFVATAKPAVQSLMSSAATLKVPLKVEVGSGMNWDEAHG